MGSGGARGPATRWGLPLGGAALLLLLIPAAAPQQSPGTGEDGAGGARSPPHPVPGRGLRQRKAGAARGSGPRV